MEPKFYYCKHCKNLVLMMNDSGVNPVCCGEPMKLLVANTEDGAHEKHVPHVVLTGAGDELEVFVGEVEHPMTEAHHIAWIYVQTKNGGRFKKLDHTEKPYAKFLIGHDEPVAVYEFCNLHGLYKTIL